MATASTGPCGAPVRAVAEAGNTGRANIACAAQVPGIPPAHRAATQPTPSPGPISRRAKAVS